MGHLEHRDDVVDLVLPVGVVGDDPPHLRDAEGVLEAGLQGSALAEVDRMPYDDRAGELGLPRTVVRGPVVDAHHVRKRGSRPADDVTDDLALVVEGDHQPDVVVAHRVRA